MIEKSFPFGVTDWAALPAEEHKGESGTSFWRTVERGGLRMRTIDYSPGFRSDHWCARGHVLLVLEGELAVTLRDEQGDVFGILGLNFDVSGLVQTQRTLANLAAAGRVGGEVAPETEEIFADDIRDVVAGMVAKILNEMGKTPAAMSRDEKMEVVKRLEERGAFLVKRSAEQVADALDLSRYTIFSYLKEIRRPGASAAAAGAPSTDRGRR